MTSYEFSLRFRLPAGLMGFDEIEGRLATSGCTDALVGLGLPGYVGLEFTREARSAMEAIQSALDDVAAALPGAELIEAGPDYVGLTEVADLVGQSRQNLRKLMLRHHDRFPSPVHTGNPSLWHLALLLDFLSDRAVPLSRAVHEVACVAMRLNIQQHSRAGMPMPADLRQPP